MTTNPISANSIEPWRFSDHAADIKAESCGGVGGLPAREIRIEAKPVELGGALDGFMFAGGWHLTSDEPNFGGLSGLEVLPDGDLLTVSDQGAFFRIGLEEGAPDGTGTYALMRGDDGTLLSGKSQNDAEGLAYKDGVALVSFERDHRILAFDYAGCGSAARGVLIATLPGSIGNQPVHPNRGAEALSFSVDGGLLFGYETGGAGAPIGTVLADGTVSDINDAAGPDGFAQVGRDQFGDTFAELFRSYDPFRGNRNVIRIGGLEARITKPMTVDNFEGIALQELPNGTLRVWIVSDDNFSQKQRTLLMAFDVN